MELISVFFHKFLLAFIPMFIALDVIGVIPVFLGLTQGMPDKQRKKLITDATLTALIVSLAFLVLGKMIFKVLGISEDDFRIGGGIVLLVISVHNLAFSNFDHEVEADSSVGIVPIGIPLIMGPAALTTILITMDSQGVLMTVASLLVNLFIVWLCFRNSRMIGQALGEGGSRGFAKVAHLFLAAIAVMMIRVGVFNTIGTH
jgi:multiple antibiotic resistance protein